MLPDVASRMILPRRQRARALAFENHPRRRAVLDRPARIAPLGLGVQLDPPQPGLEAGQADQGRISYQIDDRGCRAGKSGDGDWHIRLRQSEIISTPSELPSNSQLDARPTPKRTCLGSWANERPWELGV